MIRTTGRPDRTGGEGILRQRMLSMCEEFALAGPHGHRLTPPRFAIDEGDLLSVFDGVEKGLITWHKAGKFNTLDRPTEAGHWSLLSFYGHQTILNGEYLPHLAGYVELIERVGFHPHRVLFEPGDVCHRIDHAVLADDGTIVVLGEAKVDPSQPADLVERLLGSYSDHQSLSDRPSGKGRQYEAWKLAVALWTIRPPYLWLTAPGVRSTYRMQYEPLRLEVLTDLPTAESLALTAAPLRMMTSIDYR